MEDEPGGLMGFINRSSFDNEATDDPPSKWLHDICLELFANWHPLKCAVNGQWYRRKTKDDPWEPYDPEDTP